jgi:hypothetical protein
VYKPSGKFVGGGQGSILMSHESPISVTVRWRVALHAWRKPGLYGGIALATTPFA